MNAPRPTHAAYLTWSAVGLALVAAMAYVLIANHALAVGDLKLASDGDMIMYVAAAGYLSGGMLILAGRRWLWIIGALINPLVILFFFRLYASRPGVIFSPGGLITKLAQLLLEVALIYLICRRRQSRVIASSPIHQAGIEDHAVP